MKRKFIVEATGETTKTKVTIEVNTDSAVYMRHEPANFARDITDLVMEALAKKYRASRIKVSP